MKQLVKRSLTFLLLTITLSACDNSEHKEQSTDIIQNASKHISIKNPYIRAMPPGQTVSAMFMSLENASTHQYSLVAVEATVSEHVEIHEHKHIDGMMQMGQVDQILIKANSTTELAPGGYHIMLIGLKKDLTLGQKVDIKLRFKDGSAITTQSEVKNIDVN